MGVDELGVAQIERKHRVSVARAARNLARKRPEIQCWNSEALGRGLVFFRHDDVTSYAMARLKVDRFERYRSRNRRHYWSKNEEALRLKLADAYHRERVGPGGAWRRDVDIFLARRDGDVEKVARLEAEQEAEIDRILGGFRRGRGP